MIVRALTVHAPTGTFDESHGVTAATLVKSFQRMKGFLGGVVLVENEGSGRASGRSVFGKAQRPWQQAMPVRARWERTSRPRCSATTLPMTFRHSRSSRSTHPRRWLSPIPRHEGSKTNPRQRQRALSLVEEPRGGGFYAG